MQIFANIAIFVMECNFEIKVEYADQRKCHSTTRVLFANEVCTTKIHIFKKTALAICI